MDSEPDGNGYGAVVAHNRHHSPGHFLYDSRFHGPTNHCRYRQSQRQSPDCKQTGYLCLLRLQWDRFAEKRHRWSSWAIDEAADNGVEPHFWHFYGSHYFSKHFDIFQKGPGYHLDLVVIALLMIVCSAIGIPYYVAATVISIMHIDSLRLMSLTAAPGDKPVFLGIKWCFCFHFIFAFALYFIFNFPISVV